MNVTESNKLIAVFMGIHAKQKQDADLPAESFYLVHPNGKPCKTKRLTSEEGAWKVFLENSDKLYHNDWGWLMPVVEEIEQMGYFTETVYSIVPKPIHTFCVKKKWNSYDLIASKVSKTKMEAIYEGVVEFINKYNIENAR